MEDIRTSGSLPTQEWGSTSRTTTIASCKPAHSGGGASECTYPELNPDNYEPGREKTRNIQHVKLANTQKMYIECQQLEDVSNPQSPC